MNKAIITATCVLFCSAGCGGSEPTTVPPSGQTQPPTSETPTPSPTPVPDDPKPTPTPTPPPPMPLPPPPEEIVEVDLSGTWVSRVVNSQCFDGTLGQDTVQLTTISLLSLSQTDLDVEIRTEVCSVSLTEYLGNQTSYPQPAVNAIEIPDQTVQLEKAMSGQMWHPEKRISLLGWRTASNPESDGLPEEPDDPRVIDGDSDGHPGVTLNVDASIDGDIYIVNRSVVDTVGLIMDDDHISGSSHTVQAQNIVDSSPGILRFNKIEATPNPDPSASTFDMVRVETGASCAEVISMVGALFEASAEVTPCPF